MTRTESTSEHQPFSVRERQQLCDLALELGPDAPTLCEGWAVRDLVAHLVLREGHLAAVGIAVPPLAGLADRATTQLARRDFEQLVARLRKGAPAYSPFRLPAVDRLVNSMEYFIHHEDVRRAQPTWSPRALSTRANDGLWRSVRMGGRAMVRGSDVGITIERTDGDDSAVLKKGGRTVSVRGLPGELALFVYGRQQHAKVELIGDDADVAAVTGASFGI